MIQILFQFFKESDERNKCFVKLIKVMSIFTCDFDGQWMEELLEIFEVDGIVENLLDCEGVARTHARAFATISADRRQQRRCVVIYAKKLLYSHATMAAL